MQIYIIKELIKKENFVDCQSASKFTRYYYYYLSVEVEIIFLLSFVVKL